MRSVLTGVFATFYVTSGVIQPLVMTIMKDAGLADPTCQIYMLFYYLGPASVIFTMLNQKDYASWPSKRSVIFKTCGIAIFDLLAQMLNYTGAAYAGPTIFAIIYSSVTVWTAVFSYFFINRVMSCYQWIGVVMVFGGLAITAVDSVELGPNVTHGVIFVLVGSMMHALTYVMNEAIMTVVSPEDRISVRQNCATQGIVATIVFTVWQIVYTAPRFEARMGTPMQEAGTSIARALVILFSFTLLSVIHSSTYYYTLKYFPVAATSAGVMKALQAVLVFVATDRIFCGTQMGGQEMCFTTYKFLSLVTVVAGVLFYGIATERWTRQLGSLSQGYTPIKGCDDTTENNSDNETADMSSSKRNEQEGCRGTV